MCIKISRFVVTLALAQLVHVPHATAQSNVTVSFFTNSITPLNPGFAGFSTDFLDNGLEYGNPAFQEVAVKLSPGWLRYPSGTADDAFDWTNGLTITNWINDFSLHTNDQALMQDTYEPLIGMGGALFPNFAGMAANL